jgi:hypothetical protein
MKRREYLAGLGTAAAASLAGCNTIQQFRNSEPDRLEESALDGWSPPEILAPSSIPIEIPDSFRANHEERARTLLEAVPSDPDIPNAVVRDSVREDREAVLADLAAGSEADRTMAVLRECRWTRGEAAELYGTYRAATGADDATELRGRREPLRERVALLNAELEYRASSPIEAVVCYETIERLLRDAERLSRPRVRYPESPAHDVERAGDVWQSVERADAAMGDATGLREIYREDLTDRTEQLPRLAESASDLEIVVDRTRAERLAFDPSEEPADVFEFDLDRVDRELYEVAARELRFQEEEHRDHRADGRYAASIVAAGRTLGTIAAMDGVTTAIRNGDLPDEQSRHSLTNSASRAAEIISGATTNAGAPFLVAGLLDPALSAYRTAVESAGEFYDPVRAEANFRFAALSGAGAIEAASFLADRLAVKSD